MAKSPKLVDPGSPQVHESSHTLRQQVWGYVSRSPLRSLWDLEGVPAKVVAKNTWNAIFEDNLLGRSAELGFYFLFALFPTLFTACSGFGVSACSAFFYFLFALFPTLFTACSVLGLAARSAFHIYEKLIQYLSIVAPPAALGTVLEA